MAIMKNYVERFASYTTMHGFPRIMDSKATPKRLAWIIVFATAWMFFTIHTSVVLKSYFAYPIKTTTSIASGGVPFPDITLCNLGSFDFYTVYRLSKGIGEALSREEEKKEAIWDVMDIRAFFPNFYDDEENFYLNDTFTRVLHKYYELLRGKDITHDRYWKTLREKLFSRTTLSANIP